MSRRTLRAAAVGLALVAVLATPLASAAVTHTGADRTLAPDTRFMVPLPQDGVVEQILDLLRHGKFRDAGLIAKLAATPQAVWLDKGTPKEVRRDVQQALALARLQRAVPVFVAYNVPSRDCSSLSAGGAPSEAAYKAWIDAVAAGIGNEKAVVIVEPDGLGLLPDSCPVDVPATDAERYREINYAVDALAAKPRTIVYLDATHSAWLNVHDAASRLLQAGVQRAQGFYLNASNYQYSGNLVQYGTWISKCIARLSANPARRVPRPVLERRATSGSYRRVAR